jgi:hypothetical protein
MTTRLLVGMLTPAIRATPLLLDYQRPVRAFSFSRPDSTTATDPDPHGLIGIDRLN